MKIKHSLVIPCYNEEENILPFFETARKAMQSYTDDYELIFIDDGSRDGTLKELHKLFDEHKEVNISIVSFSRNFGKEAAMFAGLRYASGEYTTIIDADLQQHPEVAVKMGKMLDENSQWDMVAAYPAKRKENKLLSLIKKSFYRIINKVAEIKLIPDASDFRTFRVPVREALLSLGEYQRFSKGFFSWIGFASVSIPYDVLSRQNGVSKWNFTKLFRYAIDGILSYTNLPLVIPFHGGMWISLASVIGFFVLLFMNALSELRILFCILTFLIGFLLMGMGMVGIYMGKVYTQVKQRPIYIEKERLTNEKNTRSSG